MKRILTLCLVLSLLLGGCSFGQTQKQYTATFLTLFDTVTTIVGYGTSEEDFKQQAQQIYDELTLYHELFDVYHEYEGLNNIKTINDQAGVAAVKVDEVILAFLQDCKEYYNLTEEKVNVAMGSVLRLWHDARTEGTADPENAKLPDMEALKKAAEHCSMDCVLIDPEASTVYITDSEASLDVGAVAKGWSVQRVAENAPKGMLISVGGNVCATGPKEGKNPWVIGIQNPDGGDNLHTLYVDQEAVVTSGDYQRSYTVDGKSYHHIIDPETLMPSAYWRSVSVVGEDSGLADALSTALFLLPLEEGKKLAEACSVSVLWVDLDGQEFMTDGFKKILRT